MSTSLLQLGADLWRLTDRAVIEAEGVENVLEYLDIAIKHLEASKLPRRLSQVAKLKLRKREIAAAYKIPIPDSNESIKIEKEADKLAHAYDLFECSEARLKDKDGDVTATAHSSEELREALKPEEKLL